MLTFIVHLNHTTYQSESNAKSTITNTCRPTDFIPKDGNRRLNTDSPVTTAYTTCKYGNRKANIFFSRLVICTFFRFFSIYTYTKVQTHICIYMYRYRIPLDNLTPYSSFPVRCAYSIRMVNHSFTTLLPAVLLRHELTKNGSFKKASREEWCALC